MSFTLWTRSQLIERLATRIEELSSDLERDMVDLRGSEEMPRCVITVEAEEWDGVEISLTTCWRDGCRARVERDDDVGLCAPCLEHLRTL